MYGVSSLKCAHMLELYHNNKNKWAVPIMTRSLSFLIYIWNEGLYRLFLVYTLTHV